MRMRHAVVGILFAAVIGTALAKPESNGPEPDAILKSLYKAHAAQKGPFADRKNRRLVSQYFTQELTALLVKDATASDGEIGAYEFDPLYESQDPQVTDFKVGEVHWGGIVKHKGDEPEDGLAVVEVTFKDSGKTRSIPFRFQQDATKAWKIADISYSDGSTLAGILRAAYPSSRRVGP